MGVIFSDAEIEASSGKDADDENFPVGSFLIAAELRPAIAAYYAFARAADDIADAGHLSPEEKKRRLDAFEAVVLGQAEGLSKPTRLREALAAHGVTTDHAVDLLDAFRQDADKLRYESIDDLLAYCELSANPVGRFLLDLHGEDPALWTASDALCTSLQILNHLQDCGDDRRTLDRVYLPQGLLAAKGETVTVLDGDAETPGLRYVIDELLIVCERLNETAEGLVLGLKSRRLAAESAIIIALAKRLAQRLRKGDPLATRVALSKPDFAVAGLTGAVRGFMHKAPTERVAA